MVQTFDLAALAEHIADPFRPRPLVRLGGVEASLLIAEGPASWFRQVAHDELLLVLEGVVTLDGPSGKVVVNEGEVASAERNARHHVHSGMRTTLVLLEEVRATELGNGHLAPELGPAGQLDKRNVGVHVLRAGPFNWQRAGATGAYAVHATRLVGQSAPYVAPPGDLLLLVYRGVLDYRVGEADGTLVGSQMMVVGAGMTLSLTSERGATVLLVARRGTALPQAAQGADGSPGPTGAARPDG